MNSALNELVAPYAELELSGTAGERAATAKAVGTVVTLATGMLAVAVVIAILGIGNTVALSVLERRRESALLRALGLSRRGLLRSLLLEAVLVAAVGGVVGVALGIGYGWIGTAAALGPGRGGAVLVVPWTVLGLILAVVALAGSRRRRCRRGGRPGWRRPPPWPPPEPVPLVRVEGEVLYRGVAFHPAESGQLRSCIGMMTSRTMSCTAAATGTASSAPITPSRAPPMTIATTTAPAEMSTVRRITLG